MRLRRALATKAIAVALAVAMAVAMAACAGRASFRVGYVAGQPISELMANVVAEALRDVGARSVLVGCGELVDCVRALQAGDVDLLPEYSGSARALLRTRALEEGDPQAVRRALRDVGLDTTPSLGFSAPYVLLARPDAGDGFPLDSIEDLAALARPRFAVPPGYARQPGDGLFALARRYGLDVRPGQVREAARPEERLAAVLAGDVDVAVLRALHVERGAGLARLEDTLGFFPRYEAVVALGARAIAHRGIVERALIELYGELSADEIAPLLEEQVLRGRDPATLARRLLVAEGIIDATGPSVRRPEMVLAHGVGERFADLRSRALLALRSAFPERPVEIVADPDPMGALAEGRAALALVHTSDFFELGPTGAFAGRDPRGEAIAAVGRRAFALLVRAELLERGDNPLAARVGTPLAWTAAGKVAARLLALVGRGPALRGAPDRLVAALRAGELDAAIVALDADTRAAMAPVADDAIRVEGLARWVVAPPFFLNEARVPASEVPGARGALDTLSMQLVLAGPAPAGRGRGGPVHGGPSSAVATRGLPMPLREAEALAEAVEFADPVDPVLPSFRTRRAAAAASARADRGWLETALIVAALAYLAWAASLLARPQRLP